MAKTDNLQPEVVAVLDAWAKALREKDLKALSKCYAENVRVFDIGSQLIGYDKLAALWESCFPYFPNPIEGERKDLEVVAAKDFVVLSFLSRMTGMQETDHSAAKSWYRTTWCLREFKDGWKIVHEHTSLPVDCGEEKITYILDESR